MTDDRIRYWTLGPVTVHWHTREGRAPSLARVDLDVSQGCTRCYCPTGFLFGLHSFNTWRWLSVDWTERPCPCDRVVEELVGGEP